MRQTEQARVPPQENKALKPLAEKNLWGVLAAGEIPSLTREFVGETHTVRECTQTYPPGNQHQAQFACREQGKQLKVLGELSKLHCSLSGLSPTDSMTIQ